MEIKETIAVLRKVSTAQPRCMACSVDDNCFENGCRLMQLAADHLERLSEIAAARNGVDEADRAAIFQLGQQCMRERAATMLQTAADNTRGLIGSTLAVAAGAVRNLEVLNENHP